VHTPISALSAAVSAAATEDVAALARTYGPTVFRSAWRVLGARAAAEDVQQQVFLRLIEDPPQDVRSWPAFLTTAATRLAIDHLRRQRRWALLAPLWKADEPEDSPAEAAERAESSRFLREAKSILAERMYEIENIDITIVAEKPRIAPHREAIAASVAKMLDLPRGHVNVKATTTDHLGFIGRGEGICAMAVVLLSVS